MKFWEAVREMQDGKKIRRKIWDGGDYICMENGELIDEQGKQYLISYVYDDDEWEIYDDRKDISKVLKVLAKELENVLSNTCMILTPNEVEMLKEVLSELNEKYKIY
jgi:hypothetical protein